MKYWFTVVLLFINSFIFARDKLPYKLLADLDFNEDGVNNSVRISGVFTERTKKDVSNITIVFSLFDEDGNSAIEGRNAVVLKIGNREENESAFSFTEDISSYIREDQSLDYEIEYLYVSFIEYMDGSIWSDPFGIKRFK